MCVKVCIGGIFNLVCAGCLCVEIRRIRDIFNLVCIYMCGVCMCENRRRRYFQCWVCFWLHMCEFTI